MSTDSQFAISVLQIIIKERRTAHHKCWNNVKQQKVFKVIDVVKYHIQVNPKSEPGEVNTLYYQARGQFRVKTVLGSDLYELKQYNEPESAVRKYKSTYLYLPPHISFHMNQ